MRSEMLFTSRVISARVRASGLFRMSELTERMSIAASNVGLALRATSTTPPAPVPRMPSPTACLRSISKPLSVPNVSPVCWTTDCPVSVTPSVMAFLPDSLAPVPTTCVMVLVPMSGSPVLSLPIPLIPMEFRIPETPPAAAATCQSSQVGTSRPLFFARSMATGPATRMNSRIAGPAKAPVAAPPVKPAAAPAGPPTAKPPAAPRPPRAAEEPPRTVRSPASCPPTSAAAPGALPQPKPKMGST